MSSCRRVYNPRPVERIDPEAGVFSDVEQTNHHYRRGRLSSASAGMGGAFCTTPCSCTSRSMSSSSIGRKSVKFS
jgi:hypothetical protein